jgi:restriction endonuclease S subunit
MPDWATAPLGRLASFTKGRKVETATHPETGFLPYLGASAISGTISEYADPRGAIVAADQDILMLWDGERSGLVGKGLPGVVSSTTMLIRPQSTVIGSYLYYALSNQFEWIQNRRTGTGVPHVPKDLGRILQLPFPVSQDEQCKISTILSTLDSAIERTEALIAKGRAVKTGLMNDLLTRGVLSDGSLRPSWDEAPHLYKETRLGWVPVGWELRELRMLADVSRGKFTVRPRNDPRFYGGEYPFIQTGDVALARGRILTDFGQTLNGKGLSVSKMFLVGTIMVTIAANIADTCILGVPMCAPDSLVGVTPKAGENARFIELSIRSKKRWLEGRAPQTAQRNINLEDLRPLLIASPDRTEQAAIAARYEAADSSVKSTERELLKLQLQKAGLMPDLLSGRVSVNGLTT